MGLERPERRWFERILIGLLVLVVGFLVASNAYYQQRAGKQKTMFYQLQILRSSVNLFKVVKKMSPRGLADLTTATYKFPGEDITKRFIENAPIDKKGRVVDPFGRQYFYDSQTGWIRSVTPGYEFW